VLEKPAFIQGLFAFEGRGLGTPLSMPTPAKYAVPQDKRSQAVYFRAGNSSADLIYVVLTRNGQAMRYFPIGAKGAVHVPLAVLEDLHPGSVVEVLAAAPQGTQVNLVLDVGFMEIA
jgi:hypothetical protein